MPDTPFDFVSDPKEIFKALLESKDHGTAIGIIACPLGKGMFVTSVEDLLLGDGHENTKVVLKGHDFTGHVLETNSIWLREIEGVCRFASKFGNPIMNWLSKVMKQ